MTPQREPMHHPRLWLALILPLLLAPSVAAAQEEVMATPVEDAGELAEPDAADEEEVSVPPAASRSEVEETAQPEALSTIVRGLYLDARVGGGLAVVSAEIPEDPVSPALQGRSEELGSGSQIGFHLGYDVTDSLALELVSGATFISTRREDRVRDLGLVYGGLGARVGFEIERRLLFNVAAAAIFAQADNAVEDPETGPGVLGSLGIEYFVHVRHFSVGIDLTALAPLSPTRVFVGLTPRLKYTF